MLQERTCKDTWGEGIFFVETLLREKLELPPSFKLTIEKAHCPLVSQPPKDSPSRSIVVKLLSFRNKKKLIKIGRKKA